MTGNPEKRELIIRVDTGSSAGDLKKVADGMAGIGKSAKSVAGNLDFFKNAFIGAIAGIGLKGLASISDEMQNLESRIRGLTRPTEDVEAVMQGLLATANDTKTSVSGLATIYARLAASTKEAHLSSSTLLLITGQLQNTFRLSGATTQEAVNASIQLAQGFASGQLRGQELRSVLEQNVVFGDLLTTSLGKTRGQLYKLAEAGKLTSGVVLKAMIDSLSSVNSRAKDLGQTIEQSVTVSLNVFQDKIRILNKELGISDGFAKTLKVLIDNLDLVAVAILAVGAALVAANITTIVASVSKTLTLLSGPIGLVLAAVALLGTGIVLLTRYLGGLDAAIGKTTNLFREARLAYVNLVLAISEKIPASLLTSSDESYISKLVAEQDTLRTSIVNTSSAILKAEQDKANAEILKKKNEEAAIARAKKEIAAIREAAIATANKNDALKALNARYLSDGNVGAYYSALEAAEQKKLNFEFQQGTINLDSYRASKVKLEQADLSRQFQSGTLSLKEFRAAMDAAKLEELEYKFVAAKISLQEYNEELLKVSDKFQPGAALSVGANRFVKSFGTLSQGLAGVVESTFDKLGDAFIAFTTKGEKNFSDMVQAILDDLYKVIIRAQVIAPLAQAIGSASFFSSSSSSYVPNNALQQRGAQPFASGGVVNNATMFGHGGNKLGIMGEAGSEAILPLSRTSSGDLGVKATTSPVIVNIQNYSGGDVEQKEGTGADGQKTLDIIIHAKVREGIASGKYDKTFGQAYGLNRRGS